MKPKALILVLFFMNSAHLFAQRATLSGYIKEAATGEVLIGASVLNLETQTGTITNEYGYFALTLTLGKIRLSASHVGFQPGALTFFLRGDTVMNFALENLQLQEVVVRASPLENAPGWNSRMLPVARLKAIPVLGGEPDILKSLSFLPGISNGQEGNANIYVRGGTPDQNLILLDGIPVYNVSHLGGFLSVFNTEAINSVEVFKDGFPARYGGRLSSVIDINLREGNNQTFTGGYGIGLLNSHLRLEGPFQKERSSWIFTSRASYLGLLNLFRNRQTSTNFFDYWLYDTNAKINLPLGRGKLFASFYSGRDYSLIIDRSTSRIGDQIYSSSTSENRISWGNTTGSLRYAIPLRPNLFAKFILGYTRYRYQFNENRYSTIFEPDTVETTFRFRNASAVEDVLLKLDLDFTPVPTHHLKFGAGAIQHHFSAGSDFSLDTLGATNRYPSREFFIYLEDKIRLSSRITALPGLRWNGFDAGSRSFTQWEPRLALHFEASKMLSLRTSYSLAQQYIHLLSNNDFGLPNDIWVPATGRTPPQRAWQLAAGWTWRLPGQLDLSVDGYYKKMQDLIDYQDGLSEANARLREWEDLIERQGKGEAYGLEFLLEKTTGRLSGFLGYTLSWNFRTFSNISGGNRYPFTYDRRHDLALTFQYRFSEKWSASFNWILQSGTAVTLPVALLPLPGQDLGGQFVFAGRNNGRMPAFHRMDAGLTYQKKTRQNNQLIWRFSVYNLYNRKNPSYLGVNGQPILDQNQQLEFFRNTIRQVSLFPLIPAVNFEYNFGT